MKRYRITQLRSLDALPTGQARRYLNAQGYVRLRWLVGANEYVEVYEHRLNAGLPAPHLHVHHVNGVKDDNRPENLQVLTRAEHSRLHDDLQIAEHGTTALQRRTVHNPGARAKVRRDKAGRVAARKTARKALDRQMRQLYAEGRTTIEIGQQLGVHASTVSIHLRAVGVLMRPRALHTSSLLEPARQAVKARSQMTCECCGRSTQWGGSDVHHRQARQMGARSLPAINSPANLLNLCRACHARIEAHPLWAIEHGYRVAQGDDPAAVPVLVARSGWVLLTDAATYDLAA